MSMINIDLRHLRYFLAVAEELNFSRAAERLAMSQPPLSYQIKLLEENMGVQLFVRTKRKVELTEAGVYLAQAATKLIQNTQDELALTQATSRGEVGELRIGIIFSVSMYPLFPEIVRAYKKLYPKTRLTFKEVLYSEGIEALYKGSLDIFFTRPYELPKKGRLRFQLFADDYLQLCLSDQHPLAKKKKVEITDLRDELILMNARQTRTQLHDQLQKLAHKAGLSLTIYQDTAFFPVIANLVASGYGVGFLPPAMKPLAHNKIIFKDIVGLDRKACHQPLVAACRKDDASLLARNFMAVVERMTLAKSKKDLTVSWPPSLRSPV